ncbi:MAG: hypothetical protein GEU86_02850 [Actinophytocola sp.]|nr:hypothetical protein [Actinophytocola sp.]
MLSVAVAREWKAGPSEVPARLRDRLAWKQAKRVQTQRYAAERVKVEHDAHRARLDQAYRNVKVMLAGGDRKLWPGRWLDKHDDRETALLDIAWRAANDCGFASVDAAPDWWVLRFEEREALRVFGCWLPAEPDSGGMLTSLSLARHRHG